MHFSILFLAAGCDSKWAPIRCSSIFEIAGLIGKVLAPMPAFPGDEPYALWRLSLLALAIEQTKGGAAIPCHSFRAPDQIVRWPARFNPNNGERPWRERF
jgi:hypothetical protein